MNNVLAIARKELRSYFASPIAYVVIGMFALTFGFFFYSLLLYFDRQSMQAGGFGGGPTVNVNEQLLRPVFLNATVIFLFVLPLITMRTYSEEKRSGSIELLLTSPVTDVEIILGKFFGALGLYIAMLAVTLLYMAILFVYGNPEWRPLVAAYLGLLLIGALPGGRPPAWAAGEAIPWPTPGEQAAAQLSDEAEAGADSAPPEADTGPAKPELGTGGGDAPPPRKRKQRD